MIPTPPRRNTSFFLQSSFWAGLFIAAGALLRMLQYARHASSGEDEVSLIVNILDRGYGGLRHVLSFNQIAPVGFLWIEKLLSQVLGASECEYSLRLFPLLAGMAALPLVWIAARKLAGPWPAVLAVALVSFSPPALRYSAEVKQYGVEMFVTAALLALAAHWPEPLTGRRAGLLALAGLAAVSLSNPAICVLAGFGLLLAVRALERRAPAAEWMLLGAVGTVWLAFFGAFYVFLFGPTVAPGTYMERFWAPSMLSSQPGLVSAARFVLNGALYPVVTLGERVPLALYAASGLLLAVGVVLALRKKELACLCLFPLLLALAAALAGRYNFSPRLMTYSIPLVALLMANALSWTQPMSWTQPLAQRKARFAIAFAALCCAFVLLPAKVDVYLLRHEIQSLRTGVRFALRQCQPGDAVYLYSRSVPGWMYYSTDWHRPDRERLAWLTQTSRLTGPNGGNIPPRGRRVQNEGADFQRPFRGGVEIVGLADGIFRSSAGPGSNPPDPGWVENEYARMARDARTGRAILVGLTPGAHGVTDLLDYCRREGAIIVADYRAPGAIVAVLQLPRPSSHP